MDKAFVAQRVATKLFSTEKAVDAAMVEAAELLAGMIEARGQLKVSAITGDAAQAKLVEAICEPMFINDLALRLSTSIGISIYPDDAETVDTLISIADYALYEAKRAGKNRFATGSAKAATIKQAGQTTPVTPDLAPHR